MTRESHLKDDSRSSGDTRRLWAAIATLATRQHGVIAHHQLLQLGASLRQIQYWIAARRLHRLHEGVYAVGHRALTKRGRYMAAVLSAGDGAILSHCSA